MWNEVVLSLRKKVVSYGLDVFYDNAGLGFAREQYNNEEDLKGIKDCVLLRTLKNLELISDIVYRKLNHILDMRNQIGASHPNSYSINSFELLGWLKICVEKVIADKPSNNAICINKILENFKKNKSLIDDITLSTIDEALVKIPSTMCGNLLRALFRIYVSVDTSLEIKNNALKLSVIVWKYCNDDVKYDLGEKKLQYKNNLQNDSDEYAYKFFEKCGGLSYLSLTEKSLQISHLCDDLIVAHNSWDNYYHEPYFAMAIMKYIKKSSDIPETRIVKLLNTFIECRIGREVIYCNGVSPGAKQYYDSLFNMLSEKQVKVVIVELQKHLDGIYNGNSIKAKNALEIIRILKHGEYSDRMKEILDYIIEFANKGLINKFYGEKGFKDITVGVLQFN